MSQTITIHRVFSAPPERVFRAFTDPEAMIKWMPPHGFTAKVHYIDVRVGAGYKISFTNFTTGFSHSFTGTYVEIIPNKLIRYTDRFDDPDISESIFVTVHFNPVMVGTELNLTLTGIPNEIPAEACYLGWQESLNLLGLLVNPEIPDV